MATSKGDERQGILKRIMTFWFGFTILNVYMAAYNRLNIITPTLNEYICLNSPYGHLIERIAINLFALIILSYVVL